MEVFSMSTDPQAEYDAVASEITATSSAITGKMFGMPAVKVAGKAFAGYHGGDMVFKLSGGAHARTLAVPGAHLFDPMGGRPMKEWVVVPADQAALWADLAEAALEYCDPR